MNFIKVHLISRICKNYREISDKFSQDGFIYLNNDIGGINRIGRGRVYKEDNILPVDWRKICGKDLLKIKESLEENNYFFYKEIDKKFFKIRPKKDDKQKL